MAVIHCEVSGCRFNARQRCTLTGIQIAVGSVTNSPLFDPLQSQADELAGYARRGYASEFLAYAEYAETVTELQPQPGPICYSFAPL